MKIEKTYCRVHSWQDNSTIVEFFLPNGEILRIIKGELYNKIYNLTKGEIGSDFYFVAKEDDNGILSVDIEEYILSQEDIDEANKLYKELEEMMG